MFMYATKIKGISYRDLGLSKPHGNVIKNHKHSITDQLFNKLLETLTAKDIILLLKTIREWMQGRARRLAWLGRRPYEQLGGKRARLGGGPGFKSPRAHYIILMYRVYEFVNSGVFFYRVKVFYLYTVFLFTVSG